LIFNLKHSIFLDQSCPVSTHPLSTRYLCACNFCREGISRIFVC